MPSLLPCGWFGQLFGGWGELGKNPLQFESGGIVQVIQLLDQAKHSENLLTPRGQVIFDQLGGNADGISRDQAVAQHCSQTLVHDHRGEARLQLADGGRIRDPVVDMPQDDDRPFSLEQVFGHRDRADQIFRRHHV